LRIVGARGQPCVRRALIRFARWLRANYSFPIRVPVYLSPMRRLRTSEGEEAVSSFFAPYRRDVEPHIRLATGDYAEMREFRKRDDCLASYIVSLSRQVVLYQHWLKRGRIRRRGVKREATRRLRLYERTTDHP